MMHIQTKKNKIIICELKENCTADQYKKFIEHLNVDWGVIFSPHYVVDFNGDVIELLSPEYLGNATGHKHIDWDSISIVVTGENRTEHVNKQLDALLKELFKKFPIISPLKYDKDTVPDSDSYLKYGVYDKNVFPKLGR